MYKTKQYEAEKYKLDPKLRMIENGSEAVNAKRAWLEPTITIQQNVISKQPQEWEELAKTQDDHRPTNEVPDQESLPKQKTPPAGVLVNVFVQLRNEEDVLPTLLKEQSAKKMRVRNRDLIAATIPLRDLPHLAVDPSVAQVEIAERLVFDPTFDEGPSETAPEPRLPESTLIKQANGGEGVIIGIVDVHGFDFAHPDFIVVGETRFLSIWDQGGRSRPAPKPFKYGAEITRKHMNRAIKEASRFRLPATKLEPQSTMNPGSHGTHVASIAAGKSGLCPKADIAAVLIALPREDLDPRKSFYDSTRITHAVDYLLNLAEKERKPISINISLGTNGHAHDASSATSRWIDYELAAVGRIVCVAAGNAGQEAPSHPQDLGFRMGRIHSSGQVAQGAAKELEWIVAGDGILDISENELEIWYSAQDHFALELIPPNGETIRIVKPGEYLENRVLENGTVVSIYNELYHPANGSNYIACYLSPFYVDYKLQSGIRAGTWRVRLHGLDVRDGEFHAWIERDDPRRRPDAPNLWQYPSFFSELSNVDQSSVSSLACGQRIVSVANYDAKRKRISKTSSEGPTRDGRDKPNIAAPGTNIVAANGFDPGNLWVKKSGTSMASPYVAGVAGLMFAVNPDLTAAQINGILARTAKPLRLKDFVWKKDSGYGIVQPEECIREAKQAGKRVGLNP